MFTTTKQGNILFQGLFSEFSREAEEVLRMEANAARARQDQELAARGYVFSHEECLHDECIRHYKRSP